MTNKKRRTNRVKLTQHELTQLDLFFTQTLAPRPIEIRKPTVGVFPPDVAAVRYANCLHEVYDSEPDEPFPPSQPSKLRPLPSAQKFSAVTDDPQPSSAGE